MKTIYDSTREKYRNDAVYRSLVDFLAAMRGESRLRDLEVMQAIELAIEIDEDRQLARIAAKAKK